MKPGSILKDGDTLVVSRAIGNASKGAPLPLVCVKCGASSTRSLAKTFYWHEPAIYFLILLSPLIYAIVALVARKRMDLEVPFCTACWSRRRNLIVAAWLLTFGGVGLMVLSLALQRHIEVAALFLIAALLCAVVMGVIASNPIGTKRIDDLRGIFKGFHPNVLRHIS